MPPAPVFSVTHSGRGHIFDDDYGMTGVAGDFDRRNNGAVPARLVKGLGAAVIYLTLSTASVPRKRFQYGVLADSRIHHLLLHGY